MSTTICDPPSTRLTPHVNGYRTDLAAQLGSGGSVAMGAPPPPPPRLLTLLVAAIAALPLPLLDIVSHDRPPAHSTTLHAAWTPTHKGPLHPRVRGMYPRSVTVKGTWEPRAAVSA